MADQVTDLQATLILEREENTRKQSAMVARIAELEAKEKMAQLQLNIATSGSGIPSNLEKDVVRRMQLGLTKDQAIDCSRRQWDNDLRVQKEAEALAASKVPAAETKPATETVSTSAPEASGKGAKK